ncbi:hypothetical protein OBBRIDRAFT_788909 [Obba rivulosa]|uniref:Uncharacterized protein n=1 Tax=Obba rivulosa TaxID=1052685 RepID=A0A8E2DSJ3_9APHY|nr:hypothetical protein OBBRIDRAFT_788909 [Obba rivulosa]
MRLSLFVSALALGVISVLGQTLTTTDDLGETIVEFITIDPILEVTTTQILETLTTPALATTPPTTIAPTTAPAVQQVQQGPVGAPPATPAVQEPTSYIYTTTDANGNTIALTATFTPTSPAMLTHSTISGSIMAYSQWLGLVGTNTVVPSSNGATPFALERRWLGMAAGTLAGALGGAWLLLA